MTTPPNAQRKHPRWLLTLGLALSTTAALGADVAPMLAPGNAGDTTADGVLGQLDFVHNVADFVDARGINSGQYSSGDVAIDRSPVDPAPDRVYATDYGNHRVLGWKSIAAFASKAPADIVIGQPDFSSNVCNNGGITARSLCNPVGVAVDSKGNLYIADTGNNRVLFYKAPLAQTQTANFAAIDVFGQFGSFTINYSNNSGIGPNTLYSPVRLTLDEGDNLYVADQNNQRVLEFNSPAQITAAPGSGDTTADRVFGQLNAFNTNTYNCNAPAVSNNTLCYPAGLATFKAPGAAASDLYVADQNNHRVLVFTSPLTTNTTADKVYGQPDFTQNTANNGGLNQLSLNTPTSVALNSAGDLLVADSGNHRVLQFPAGLNKANRVLGQFGAMNTNICNNTGGGTFIAGGNPKNLCTPNGVAVDSTDNVYVADTRNNRILRFDAPLTLGSQASGVLGQQLLNPGATGGPSSNTSIANGLDARGFNLTYSSDGVVAIDRSSKPNRVYVSDPSNHRVLGWSDVKAFATHAPANVVLGQPNPFTGGNTGFGVDGCNNGGLSAKSLCHPRGLAVDSTGNLYVADQNNNRVLIYKSPIVSGASALKVLGQSGSFTSNSCNSGGGLSANSLCTPVGVAVDTAGNVYVGDFSNNRVLAYSKPLTTDTTADKVFGQSDVFTSNTCNLGGVPSQQTLCNPHGVAVDAKNNLYVTDYSNNRALEFNAPLAAAGNTVADKVFGQNNSFASGTCNLGGPVNADTLCRPRWVTVDVTDNVYIADTDNARVLAYRKPLTTNRTADRVFGQGNVMTAAGCKASGVNSPFLSPNTLCVPEGLATDSTANLYVTDAGHNRVLMFLRPLSAP
ncbi:MAG: NHL repeat-containing protein [Methylotetracoccus sp.]